MEASGKVHGISPTYLGAIRKDGIKISMTKKL